jgi:hypothetical protein
MVYGGGLRVSPVWPGQPISPRMPGANNVTFQFPKPATASSEARILTRQPSCPACPPTGTATLRWQQRGTVALFLREHGRSMALGCSTGFQMASARSSNARRSLCGLGASVAMS